MTDRLEVIAGWWAGLGPAARDHVGQLPRGGGSPLSADVFLGLVDTGTLAVTAEQRHEVADGQTSSPMPFDIVAHVFSYTDRLTCPLPAGRRPGSIPS